MGKQKYVYTCDIIQSNGGRDGTPSSDRQPNGAGADTTEHSIDGRNRRLRRAWLNYTFRLR